MIRNLAKQALIEESPWPPSHPKRSADLSILRAWMDADPAPSCLQPVPPDSDMPGKEQRCGRCIACRRHHATVVAAVETAVKQAQQIQSRRRLGWYWTRMSPGVRALIARSHGEGLKELLGYWDKGVGFQDGLAGLSEREAFVYWHTLRGWRARDIQRLLQPSNVRQLDPSMWPEEIEVVYRARWRAKAKILAIFGLPVDEKALAKEAEEDA